MIRSDLLDRSGPPLARISHEHCGNLLGTTRKMRAASSSIAFHISHSVHEKCGLDDDDVHLPRAMGAMDHVGLDVGGL